MASDTKKGSDSSQKTQFAQSSSSKPRDFLEYRLDMKKKAIIELEILPFLQETLRDRHNEQLITVKKHGADEKMWFLREGKQPTHDPDYLAILPNGCINLYEFQNAENGNRTTFDFKVSKVGKKIPRGTRVPHSDREFFYVIFDECKYAFFTPEWVMENGSEGFISAWRSNGYTIPHYTFKKIFLDGGPKLKRIIQTVNDKRKLLEFQRRFITQENRKLGKRLEQVIDENSLFKITPRTLQGFYEVCFLMNKLNRKPTAANVWLVYLAALFDERASTIDFARFMFALDFIYFKCVEFNEKEEQVIKQVLANSYKYIEDRFDRYDGLFITDPDESEIEGTTNLLFAVNLLEDFHQDAVINFEIEIDPVEKIFQSVPNTHSLAKWICKVVQD